jgi:hypothetical protein
MYPWKSVKANRCPRGQVEPLTSNRRVALIPAAETAITAVPTSCVVTLPFESTLATEGVSEFHVTTGFATALPDGSWTTAVAWYARHTRMSPGGIEAAIEEVSEPGAATRTRANPLLPSELAEMLAVPGARAVTSPVASTEAIEGASVDHVTVRSDSAVPARSWTTAVARVVSPIDKVGDAMDTLTDATAGGAAGDTWMVVEALELPTEFAAVSV